MLKYGARGNFSILMQLESIASTNLLLDLGQDSIGECIEWNGGALSRAQQIRAKLSSLHTLTDKSLIPKPLPVSAHQRCLHTCPVLQHQVEGLLSKLWRWKVTDWARVVMILGRQGPAGINTELMFVFFRRHF